MDIVVKGPSRFFGALTSRWYYSSHTDAHARDVPHGGFRVVTEACTIMLRGASFYIIRAAKFNWTPLHKRKQRESTGFRVVRCG